MSAINWTENQISKDTDDVINDQLEGDKHIAKADFSGDSNIPDSFLEFNRTTKRWEEYSGGSAADIAGQAEVNTMANVGSGVGVYKSKSGVQFQMKSIKANSSKISVNSATDDVEIDVAEGNIVHANISGGGSLSGAHGATGSLADTGSSQTLLNKTLTTPTIASNGFANANHNHSDVASGGAIAYTNLTSRAHDHGNGDPEGQIPLANLTNRARLQEGSEFTGGDGDDLLKTLDGAPSDWSALIFSNAYNELAAAAATNDTLYFNVPSNGFCAIIEVIFISLHISGDNRHVTRLLCMVSRYDGGSVQVETLDTLSGTRGSPDTTFSVVGSGTQFVARVVKTGTHSTRHHTFMRVVSVAETD